MSKDQFTNFPSFIPPHYTASVARSLMPKLTPEQFAAFDKPQKARWLAKFDEYKQLVADDPVRWFRPSPGGQYDFLTCADPAIQGLYFFAGNKSGKTTGAAILVGENAAGQPLWGRNERHADGLLLGSRVPLRICAFCEDFSTHEETIVPTILSWIPRSLLASKPVERGPSGNLTAVLFANGSRIYLRTYDQGYEKAEGKDYDLVWCDEPPSRDIYTAIWRGLVANKGRIIISATLLSETWLYDELSNPFIRTFEASMYDNSWLSPEGRANYESLLNEEERNIRIWGKPSNLTGLIYPTFRDASPFVIPESVRVWDPVEEEPYPIICGVDPHERKGIYMEWAWLTPQDHIVWFDWRIIPPDKLSEQFEQIAAVEATHTSTSQLVIMDPNRGKAKQMNDVSWEDSFIEHGYETILGQDAVNFGHSAVRDMLASIDSKGQVIGEPLMQWMETCRGKGGPIHQMLRYNWDDHPRGRRNRYERSVKEKPREAHKDFPDIHRYVACAHLEYDVLARGGHTPLTLKNLPRTRFGSRTANPYA